MQICEFAHSHPPIGRWVADWSRPCSDYSDANAIMRAHRPVLQFSLREVFGLPRLNEATYKELVARIDSNFLRQGERAQALRGVFYKSFDHDTMVFNVTSSEEVLNGIQYLNLIKFMAWDEYGGNPDMTPREKGTQLLWMSDIQVHCDDPSFLYWGYQYILTQVDSIGAAIYPEPRPPVVRNPNKRGIVCKHLNRVFRSLPFFIGDIAKAVTEQWGGKIDKKEVEAIRRRTDLQRQANALPADQVQPEPDPMPDPDFDDMGTPPDDQAAEQPETPPAGRARLPPV